MIVVLSLGPAFAHLYDLPAKIAFEGELGLELLQRLYPPAFGTANAHFEQDRELLVLTPPPASPNAQHRRSR